MTVKELIEQLNQADPDDVVFIQEYNCKNGCGNAEVIEVDVSQVGVITLYTRSN